MKLTCRATGHFVTLTECGIHLTECNPRHISKASAHCMISFVYAPHQMKTSVLMVPRDVPRFAGIPQDRMYVVVEGPTL